MYRMQDKLTLKNNTHVITAMMRNSLLPTTRQNEEFRDTFKLSN